MNDYLMMSFNFIERALRDY